MKFHKYWIFLILISNVFAFAKTRIIESPTGISIKINAPIFSINKPGDSINYMFSDKYASFNQYVIDGSIKSNYLSFNFTSDEPIEKSETKYFAFYRSLKQTKNIIISDTGSFKVSFSGIRRGVKIYQLLFKPAILNAGEVFVLDSLSFSLVYHNILKSAAPAPEESVFFADIVNPKMLNCILAGNRANSNTQSSGVKKTTNRILNSDGNVYKVETQRDGIAKLTIADLQYQTPGFSGKPISQFNLRHRGVSVPIYYKDDGDGKISGGDVVYFMGERAAGDTTWFSHYTNKEPFFVECNTNSVNPRIGKRPSLNVTNRLYSVTINKHIEKDSSYFEGKTSKYFPNEGYLDVGPAEFEGWYWAQLPRIDIPTDTAKYRFNYSKLFLSPSNNANDSLEIAVNYSTLNYRQNRTDNPYRLELKLNGNREYFEEFNRLETAYAKTTKSNIDLMAGLNVLDVFNYFMKLNDPSGDKRDWLGIDHIRISGKVAPFAYLGEFSFSKDANPSPVWVQIPGFNTKNVLVYSALDTTFEELVGLKGVSFAAGASKGSENYLTSVIDSKENSTKSLGANLVIVSPTGKYYYISNDDASDFINEINKAPNESVIIIYSNKDYFLSSDLKSLLTQLGSKQALSADPTSAWAFACKKGGNEYIFETFNTNVASLTGFIPYAYGASYQADVTLTAEPGKYVVMDENSVESVKVVKDVFLDLKTGVEQAECVYIYRKDFEAPVKRLADYRRSQNNTIMTIEASSIYDEFNSGKKAETAIKDFLSYAYHNWKATKLKYVVLFGDASMDCRGLMPKSREDVIPTIGFPASDYYYSLIDGGEYDLQPELIVARIPGPTPETINNYIDKLIAMESQSNKPWMKNFLLLNGGSNSYEIDYLNAYSNQLAYRLTRPSLKLDTVTISKSTNGATTELQGSAIRSVINGGAVWTNFMGHAAAEIFDLDGWQVNLLNNVDKFGVLSAVSCNSCAFTEPIVQCRGESYITAKDKGFTAVIGSSSVGFAEPGYDMIDKMYLAITDSLINIRRIGDLLTYSKYSMLGSLEDLRDPINLMKSFVVLFGDPMMKIRIPEKTDYYFNEEEFTVVGSDNSGIINSETEYISLSGVAYNASFSSDSLVTIELTRKRGDFRDVQTIETKGFAKSFPFTFKLPVDKMTGLHDFTISIKAPGVQESNYLNNEYKTSVYVYSTSLSPLEPLAFWNVNYKAPKFRQLSPYSDSANFEYSFILYKTSINDTNVITKSTPEKVGIKENNIDWNPSIVLEPAGKYILESFITNKTSGAKSSSAIINFTATDSEIKDKVKSELAGRDFTYCKTDSMDLISSQYLQISSNPININVVSVKGEPGDHNKRWAFIQFGDKIYFNNYHPIGFKVVTVDRNNYQSGELREYNTFAEPASIINMINFLKDTLGSDKYLALAHSDEIMPGNVDYQKYLDTLKLVMNKFYGAKLIDSLVINKSYAYLGVKNGGDDLVFEALNTMDSAKISKYINNYKKSGTLETMILGAAQNWENVRINSTGFSSNDFKIIVSGYNSSKSNNTILIDTMGVDNLDLSKIPAIDYPYLKFNFIFNGGVENSAAKFYGFNLNFVPSPEIAISKKSISFSNQSLLECDTNFVSFSASNLSLRVASGAIDAGITVNSTVGGFVKNIEIPSIERDSKSQINTILETKSVSGQSNSVVQLSLASGANELYQFNNSGVFGFNVFEDTVKPTAKVYFDGKLIQNGSSISNHPKIEVFVYDNSLKEVTDTRAILTRLNGTVKFESNTSEYNYKTYGFSRPLKSSLSFYPDTLIERENSFNVYFMDGNNNKDTLKYILHVPSEAKIDSMLVYPNPTNSDVSVKFDFSSPIKSGRLLLNIYDFSGRKVKQVEKNVQLGENVITFEAKDEKSNSLAQGVYYFIVTVEDNIYLEPMRGKFSVIY